MKNLIAIFLLSMAMLISSCGISNRKIQKEVSKTDSVGASFSKSDSALEKDSVSVKRSQRSVRTDSVYEVAKGVKVEFFKGDSAVNADTMPLKIFYTDSGLIINAGIRKIKSVEASAALRSTKVTERDASKKDSSHVTDKMANKTEAGSSANVSKENSRTDKNTTRFQLPWYAYLLIPVAALLVYWLWPYVRNVRISHNKETKDG